jgi:hypothetical protein
MLKSALLGGALILATSGSYPPSPSRGVSQQDHQNHGAHEHPASGSADKKTQASIFTIQFTQSDNKHSVAADTKQEGKWYASPDWWVAGFTGALFFATLGLWIFTALMWWAAKEAGADTKASLVVANKNADTLVNQLTHQKDEAYIRLRPYLHLGETLMEAPVDDKFSGTTKFQNFGQTPAVMVNVMVSHSTIGVHDSVEIAVAATKPIAKVYSRPVVQGRHTVGYIGPISLNEVLNVLNGAKRIIVVAKAEYEDTIKGKVHYTQEVWDLIPIPMGFEPEGSRNKLTKLGFSFRHVPGFWIGT